MKKFEAYLMVKIEEDDVIVDKVVKLIRSFDTYSDVELAIKIFSDAVYKLQEDNK